MVPFSDFLTQKHQHKNSSEVREFKFVSIVKMNALAKLNEIKISQMENRDKNKCLSHYNDESLLPRKLVTKRWFKACGRN